MSTLESVCVLGSEITQWGVLLEGGGREGGREKRERERRKEGGREGGNRSGISTLEYVCVCVLGSEISQWDVLLRERWDAQHLSVFVSECAIIQ